MIITDAAHALMNQREFDQLLEYSTSLPTGTTLGKRWKRRIPPPSDPHAGFPGHPIVWWMGQYVGCDIPGQTGIEWREILVVP